MNMDIGKFKMFLALCGVKAGSGGGSGISDAPSDGGTYARKNAGWAAIQSLFVLATAVGAANGVASLDATGKVPAAQIPTTSGATATIRNIATKCRTAGAINPASTLCWSRSLHVNHGGNQTQLAVVLSNWYASYQGEFTPSAANTMSAAIEYPEGVYTQLRFNGAYSVAIPGGQNAVSDFSPIAIPDGARFWVRIYQSCSAGTLSSSTACLDRIASAIGTAGGNTTIEVAAYGTSAATIPDATSVPFGTGVRVNGFGPAGNNSSGFFPSAILGLSSRPSILVVGDSRNAGLQDSAQSNFGYSGVGEICRSLDPFFAYCNVGYPTDQAQTFVTWAGTTGYRKALGQYYSHVHSQYGINDLIFLQTVAQLQASQTAIKALFPGKTFSLSTLPPKTASTDAWVTNANQTVDTVTNPLRMPYNVWIRTKPLGVQAALDPSSYVEEPTTPGKWKSPDISTWTNAAGTTAAIASAMTGDGTHETPYCYGLIQASGMVTATTFS